MQSSVPKGEGGMIAVLGSTIELIENLLKKIENLKHVLLQMIIQKVK